MSKVYFSKNVENVLDLLDDVDLGETVGIKVHFGEKGCTTYMNPKIVRKVYEKVLSLGKKASLVETNVLYKGSRTNSKEHIKTAIEHGFDFAPIDFLDGENGEEFVEVGLSKVKLGKGSSKYDSMIVISHFTGHICAGFGGGIKNISMGLASRGGKLHMHSDGVLKVDSSKCSCCGKCLSVCNFSAVDIEDGCANINSSLCVGCAGCTGVCPEGAVRWEGCSSEDLQRKIVDYALASKEVVGKMVFINILEDITLSCDCLNLKQEKFIEDVGILYSDDVVSIDNASVDLVDDKSCGKFKELKDGGLQLSYGCERGLEEEEYELIDVL